MDSQTKKYLDFAEEIAKKSGQKLFDEFRTKAPVERGTSKEVKSFYDNFSDEIIKEDLEKKFPEHSYITEETGLVDKKSDYLWIIDPLDGTSNFVNHNPLFSISIALWKNGEPLLGVIEAPALYERFVSVSGEGAWRYDFLNSKEKICKVSNISEDYKAYILFCEGGEGDRERILKIFNANYKNKKEVRKFGSAAIELAWVGAGRAEAYFTPRINIWDIAAGVLFVKEAGGEVKNFAGKDYNWKDFDPNKKFDLFAGNGQITLTLP